MKAEARLLLRHTCSTNLMLVHLLCGFVFLHNPYKPVCVLQLTVLVLGITSRALLSNIPEGVGADSHQAFSYGFMYIVDSTWVLILYFVALKRSQAIKSRFAPDQATQVNPCSHVYVPHI